MRSILFRPTQKPILVEFTGWDDLLKHVGCEVLEPITLRQDLVAYVDEEARLGPSQTVNYAASRYVRSVLAESDRILAGDTIVNNMILVGTRKTDEGEVETDVPDNVIQALGL